MNTRNHVVLGELKAQLLSIVADTLDALDLQGNESLLSASQRSLRGSSGGRGVDLLAGSGTAEEVVGRAAQARGSGDVEGGVGAALGGGRGRGGGTGGAVVPRGLATKGPKGAGGGSSEHCCGWYSPRKKERSIGCVGWVYSAIDKMGRLGRVCLCLSPFILRENTRW